MVTQIKSVCIYVSDVDRAIGFYSRTLGFEKLSDARQGAIRWVELRPPRGETVIALASEGFPVWSPEKVGQFSGVTLAADDPDETFAALRSAGVRFQLEPEATAWGHQAVIEDPDGNAIVVVAA